MTEQPPDIPPWSPLADPARLAGGASGGRTATPGSAVGGGVTVEEPAAGRSDGATQDPVTAPTPARDRRWWWLLPPLVAVLVIGIALAAGGGGDPAPSPTTTVRAPLPATSFEEPAAMGSRVALGNGWIVAVLATDGTATRALQSLNARTAPLAEGQQYVLIDLELAYLDGATETDSPFHGVDLAVMGDDGELVTPADSPCTVPPPALDTASEIPRGRSERGRICFAVDADQVASLRLVAEPSMAYGSAPSWFELGLDR
jgi:hypothetical protein